MTSDTWVPRVKLAPPRAQASQVGRADLLGPVAGWRDAKLLLIHGPAGFGKTVLLSQIYSALGATHCARAWMSLSEDERNTDAFLSLLWNALQPVLGTSTSDPSPVPQIPANHHERVLLDRVLRDLDAIDQDVWIFIDDLQFADAPASMAALRKLLRLTAQNVRFVFASRSMVDLGVAHLRADGRSREVTSQELRFSRAHIARFLAGALLDHEVDQVLADTGGWPVAVRLLKSCLEAGSTSYAALVAQGRPRREMFEYLSQHILAGVTAPVEEFLITTSICERIHVDLASVMLGGGSSAPLFEAVLRMHLPIEPCADRPGWYQYHSLFAEFLRAAAVQRMPQKMKAAHTAAGRWFAERQSWAEALHHAFHGGTLGDTLSVLEQAGGVRMALRYGHRTLRPLANLESHLTRDFPLCRLGQIYYWTLEGQVAGARAALEELRGHLTRAGSLIGHPAALDLLVIDLLVAVYEERPLSVQDLERLELALKDAPPALAPLAMAGQGMVVVGYFHSFQFDRCRAANEATLLAYRSIQSPYSETFLHVYAVLVELEQGRLKDAREAVARLTTHIRERLGPQEALRHLPELLSAELSYESADFEGAIEQLERARAGFGSVQGWFDLQIQLLRASSLILLRTRGLEAALALIEDADARTIAMGQRKAATACALHRANLLLRAGEWPAAKAVIESERVTAVLAGPLDRMQPTYVRVYAGELRAEVDLTEERPAEAEENLRALVAFARDTGWSAALARLTLLDAAALEQLANPEAAAKLASEGLDVARRAGLRSCIADRAELIAAPIERLLAAGHLTLDKVTLEYWRSIVGGAEAPEDAGLARQRLRMRLSPRQMQVLELLAHGCSSKEIADRLGLGLGTVKAHRISLYRKLGVRQRSGAVAAFQQIQALRR